MSQPKSTVSRRTLFAGAATVGALGAAATLMPHTLPEAPASLLKEPPERGGGYQLSEHVKKYYKTTRI